MRFWAHTPPEALALKRISLFLGMAPTKPKEVAKSADEAVAFGSEAGFGVSTELPKDAGLDLLNKIGW